MKLDKLRQKAKEKWRHDEVEIEGLGTFHIRELSTPQRLEVMNSWEAAGLIKIESKEGGGVSISGIDEGDIDLDTESIKKYREAYDAAVLKGVLDDEGRYLFDSDEGREVLAELDDADVAKLATAIMDLSAPDTETDEAGN